MRLLSLIALSAVSFSVFANGAELPPGATLKLGEAPLRTAGQVYHVALSPDGSVVAAGAQLKVIYVWDARTAKRLQTFHLPRYEDFYFSSDGAELHVLGSDAQGQPIWKRWKVTTWEALADGKLSDAPEPRRAYWRMKGARLAPRFDQTEKRARLWDEANDKEVLSLPIEHQINPQFSPDGKIVGIHVTDARFPLGRFEVWNIETQKKIAEKTDFHPGFAALTSDGKGLIACKTNATPHPIEEWDLVTGERKRVLVESFSLQRLFLGPHNRHWVATGRRGNGPLLVLIGDLTQDNPPFEYLAGGITTSAPAFSKDGRLIAFGTSNAVKIWDATTGKLRFDGDAIPAGPVLNLALSRDRRFVAANGGERIVLWDVAAKQPLFNVECLNNSVLRMSPDADFLAIARSEPAAVAWSRHEPQQLLAFPPDVGNGIIAAVRLQGGGQARGLENGIVDLSGFDGDGKFPMQKQLRCRGHAGPVRAIAYSADGRWVISRGSDNTIRVWNGETGAEVRKIEAVEDPNRLLALSAGGAIAAWMEEEKLRLFDVKAGESLATVGAVIQAAFAPEGTGLAIAGRDFATLVDPTKGKELHRYDAKGRQLSALAYRPDGKRVLIADQAGQVTVHDAKLLTLLDKHDIGQPVRALRLSNDGRRLVILSPRTIIVWDLETGKRMSQFPHRQAIAFAHVQEGKAERIALLTGMGSRASHDAITGEGFGGDWSATQRKDVGDCVVTGQRELIGTAPASARIWSLETGAELGSLSDKTFYGSAAALSADEKHVALGGDGISIWNVRERRMELRITAAPSESRNPPTTVSLGFSPDGRKLAAIDTYVRIYDARSGKQLSYSKGASPEPRRRPVPPFRASPRQALSFSDDGRLLILTAELGGVTPLDNCDVLFLDTLTGRVALRLDQAPFCTRCAVLVDEETLVTGDSEGQILFWDFQQVLARKFPPERFTVDQAWDRLADADPAVAWQAVSSLEAQPAEALRKIQTWLDEKPELTGAQLDDLMLALGSTSAAERTIALPKVMRAGSIVDERLDKLLAKELPADLRASLQALREGLPLDDHPDMMRPQRVVHVLERLGPQAKHLLERLATGRAWKLAKVDAETALERLAKERH